MKLTQLGSICAAAVLASPNLCDAGPARTPYDVIHLDDDSVAARGWTRTLRLARTIADLDGSGSVRRVHVAEALVYRRVAPGTVLGASPISA